MSSGWDGFWLAIILVIALNAEVGDDGTSIAEAIVHALMRSTP